MKKIIAVITAAVFAVICPLCVISHAASVYASFIIPSDSMRMIAHRGYSSIAPENTLPAYIAAGKSDFWGAECDIQQTSDGAWVIMHDSTVDRTTDGTGVVGDMTYEEIQNLTIDAGNNVEKYPGTKVPTLEEYLDVCKEYGLHPVIEIKEEVPAESMQDLSRLLLAREEKDMFVIISFGRDLCKSIKELMPDTPVYYLVSKDATQKDIDFAAENGLDGMDIHYRLSDSYVKSIQNAGLDVIVWTVDDVATAERCYRNGVRAVTTNALTQEEPTGNAFEQILWKLRDFFAGEFNRILLKIQGLFK